jgi:hypothetical protein
LVGGGFGFPNPKGG